MRLEINCQDRLGIAQDILDILVEHEINLRGIEIDEMGKIFLNFPNMEFSELQHLMPKIRKIDGIKDVKTAPFMPIEREQYQLQTLLKTLPDPVFSVNTKGEIILTNDAVLIHLSLPREKVIGVHIGDLLKGFNISRWLETDEPQVQVQKIRFLEQDYLVDMLPVLVPDIGGESIMAGAVFLLKSEYRLGQQLTAFNQGVADSFVSIQAESKAMRSVVKDAKRMAELDESIMMFGETGTGKKHLAKACHEVSSNRGGKFIVADCRVLSDKEACIELLGENDDNLGLLDLANGGTLFLDEVADLPSGIQTKFLKILQSGYYQRVGESNSRLFEVRIISSTQKDLGALVQEGSFSEDLFYQLNVLSLFLPPLRERKSDIIALAERFIKQHSMKLGRQAPRLTKAFIDYLQTYPWPGNIRQLENTLYRTISLLDGNELDKVHIQLPSCSATSSIVYQEFNGSLEDEVKRFEKEILIRLYPSFPSSRQLAKRLGLSHTAVANKLRDYGINKKTVKII
ncbi:sigma 54-interacting transcriptional regulator [Paraglaciecola sp.]|uniref:sigma-54-dependent transcriptional regulator n=1 Tax=Paraglaciecola sp. TaxID=1920173 RepID=UPI003263917E